MFYGQRMILEFLSGKLKIIGKLKFALLAVSRLVYGLSNYVFTSKSAHQVHVGRDRFCQVWQVSHIREESPEVPASFDVTISDPRLSFHCQVYFCFVGASFSKGKTKNG
jgi:hypothetical protein